MKHAALKRRPKKRNPDRDFPKHLAFVQSKPCMICGDRSEAHHLLRPWHGWRGTGMKAGDMNAVPLCPEHHRQLHLCGNEEAFFDLMRGSPDAGKNEARRLWNDFWETENV